MAETELVSMESQIQSRKPFAIDLRSTNIPAELRSVLEEIDEDKNGEVTLDEVVNSVNKFVVMKKERRYLKWGIITLCIFTTILALAVFGLTVAAVYLAKGTFVF